MKLGKKIIVSTLIMGGILSSCLSSSYAVDYPTVDYYKEYYMISKEGYTSYIEKKMTGSNAVCNNTEINGDVSYHTAQLYNNDNKYRSTRVNVYEGKRKELDVSNGGADGTKAKAGYDYKQRHTVAKLGVICDGSFSVDDKYDWLP